jgi:predicted esterase/catechol 2,3-dioxygenase-like lactoylglutathione lyase family enzyme
MEAVQLSLIHLLRPPKIELPRPPVLILLHDQEDDEHALFQWAPSFDDRFLVVSPRAPYSLHSRSYTWLSPHQNTVNRNNNPHTKQSCSVLVKFIKETVHAYRADPTQVYLLGVGQGGLMSLSAMVAESEILAGVVVANGQIPAEIHSILMPSERFRDFPVFIIQGIQDESYSLANGHEARDILGALMTDLTYREFTETSILSIEPITQVRLWLSQCLNQRGVSFVPTQTVKLPPYQPRLTGISIGVRSLDRSIAFYTRFLGLQVVERIGNAYAFLGFKTASHYEIALENVGAEAPGLPGDNLGLHKIKFEVPNQHSFALAYKNLTDSGIKVITIDHLVCWALYFVDPDRNGLEIYWDTRDQPGKAHLWQGRDLPLEPEKIMAVLQEDPLKKGS